MRSFSDLHHSLRRILCQGHGKATRNKPTRDSQVA